MATSFWKNLGIYAVTQVLGFAPHLVNTSIDKTIKLIGDNKLEFKAPVAYKSAYAYWAKHEAYQAGYSYLRNSIKNKRINREKDRREKAEKAREESRKWIIENYKLTENINARGSIELKSAKNDGKTMTVNAQDAIGRKVREALFISFEDKDRTEGYEVKKNGQSTGFFTSTVYCYDLIPSISFESSKNIVQTQVQGRDFSRKELISGGDLTFTVSGNLVSHQVVYNDSTGGVTAEYPENSVQKFIQIMQYPGIIDVNHFLFKQLGVNRVVIKSFSLGAPTRINMQPYQFTCVAIEPDEEIIIKQDAIYEIDRRIAQSEKQGWLNVVIGKKLSNAHDYSVDELGRYITKGEAALEDLIASKI